MNGQSWRNTTNYFGGEAAEECVAQAYERRGFTVAHRRWRCASGEVDLIVRDGSSVVFVEVKKSRDFRRAAQRLSQRQIERIYASAAQYLANEPNGQLTDTRFDVALVDASGAIEIIENAFGHD